LLNRHDAVLAIRKVGQRLMPSLPSRVWLSFGVHNTPKLNHTLFLPPPPRIRRCEHEKSRRPEGRRLLQTSVPVRDGWGWS
jgi:hypothetical protein